MDNFSAVSTVHNILLHRLIRFLCRKHPKFIFEPLLTPATKYGQKSVYSFLHTWDIFCDTCVLIELNIIRIIWVTSTLVIVMEMNVIVVYNIPRKFFNVSVLLKKLWFYALHRRKKKLAFQPYLQWEMTFFWKPDKPLKFMHRTPFLPKFQQNSIWNDKTNSANIFKKNALYSAYYS